MDQSEKRFGICFYLTKGLIIITKNADNAIKFINPAKY